MQELGGITTARLRINGEERIAAFPTHHTLLEVLREECGLTGTKHGCELGECGTCTVLVDGRPVLSCLVLAAEMEGREVETVEGLQQGNDLHPLQAALADLGAAQCGYCTPGILMTAKALLAERPRATAPEIREALAGNLCRCTGYHKIVEAVEWAAARLRGEQAAHPREVLYGAAFPEEAGAAGWKAAPSGGAPPGEAAAGPPGAAGTLPGPAPRRESAAPGQPGAAGAPR
jgi:carbon-monoxide dehydrogenase small subunit